MTHFEYISVGASIVLSFGVIRLLDGAPSAFHVRRLYLPHAIWVAIKFMHHFMVWWNAWILRDIEWNFFYFLLQIGTPVILYLQASALVTSNPNEVADWREHFYSVRKPFFGLNAVFALSSVFSLAVPSSVTPTVILGMMLAVVILSLVGYRSTSHRVQIGIACIALGLNLFAIIRIFNIGTV